MLWSWGWGSRPKACSHKNDLDYARAISGRTCTKFRCFVPSFSVLMPSHRHTKLTSIAVAGIDHFVSLYLPSLLNKDIEAGNRNRNTYGVLCTASIQFLPGQQNSFASTNEASSMCKDCSLPSINLVEFVPSSRVVWGSIYWLSGRPWIWFSIQECCISACL
jgi:hypothetical protein